MSNKIFSVHYGGNCKHLNILQLIVMNNFVRKAADQLHALQIACQTKLQALLYRPCRKEVTVKLCWHNAKWP